MAPPPSPDPRRIPRRDSSPRSPPTPSGGKSNRRPRLLRASATEPTINTSITVSRGAALASPQSGNSTWRATDLLSRVAFVSGSSPPSDGPFHRPSSPASTRSHIVTFAERAEEEVPSSPVDHGPDYRELRHHPSVFVRYVSFPSFDIYEPETAEEEKETEMKTS